ncbi:MAG: putative polymerase ECF-type sigma factor containing repeat [Devosia sp.]|jgi:RNA polymerase sigma-70 factor (ECF subfamily)|nr:putative polymerase ECF-type sigma factor containing repeat [Devosia sp.]
MPGLRAPELEAIWRQHSRRVLATLVRLLRDFELAEEALHDAFLAAAQHWPREGMPANPAAWLVSAGRFAAIDKLRRRSRLTGIAEDLLLRQAEAVEPEEDPMILEDDQLRLIFVCCHPALAPQSQVALTLREVCGLTTEQVARAFLTRTPAMAQRIVRAKASIKQQGLPYEVPGGPELAPRLDAVLRVIYLVFNEGYSASSGALLARAELSDEAIRLARLLQNLLPKAEVLGLLGLMLLHESRRTARVSVTGDIVLLEDQNRQMWRADLIAEGTSLVQQAFATGAVGPYAVQGAIAAVHAAAPSYGQTDWAEIAGLYDVLAQAAPSAVVQLNRAVASGMARGAAVGLGMIDAILERGELTQYHLAHAARADMLRRLGRLSDARAAYARALSLCQQEPEQRFLQQRIVELSN